MANGLPIPKPDNVVTQGPGLIDGDRLSSASAWGRIAAAGASLESAALGIAEKEARQQRAGQLAEFEVRHDEWFTKARDTFNHDPKAYETEANGHIAGVLEQTEEWMLPHAKRFLYGLKDRGMNAILSETRARDQSRARESIDARRQKADDDVMALAMAGKAGSGDFKAALTTYSGVLETAVNENLISRDRADYLIEDMSGRAQGEATARNALDVYRAKGFEAASKHLRETVLENESLSLKPTERYKIFNRGMAAIRLANKEEAGERREIVQMSTDLRARVKSDQSIDPGEIRDTLDALARSGAHAEHARLSRDWAVREATAPYRNGGMPLGEFGRRVRGMRGEGAENAAMQFFTGKGYSQAQAAGIVGNLIQESGLKTTAVGDGGISFGIAQWNKERRAALESFARSRGKPVSDFETQLEFVAHELETTETGARDALKSARTPGEAAAAFIRFERPQGFSEGNPLGAHGAKNRVANAERLAGVSSDPSLPPMGEVTRQAQTLFVGQARKAWPDLKGLIERNRLPAQEDVQAIRYAASISGDANWQREVDAVTAAAGFAREAANVPQAQRLAALDTVRADFAKDGWTIDEDQVFTSLEGQLERQRKAVAENPVGYAVEQGTQAPGMLDLSSPQTAQASAGERISIARKVAAGEGVPEGNPFQPTDRALIASTIQRGNPQQTEAAFAALGAVPDTMLVPAMNAPDIKAAVQGAIRTGDPARFNQAMSFLDGLWARAPQTAKQLFGEDTINDLMTWQSRLRYLTPEQLAKERDQKALDPAIRERRTAMEKKGREIARKVTPDQVLSGFPHVFNELISGRPSPIPEPDAATRDVLMSDFESIFSRRYAETQDEGEAMSQASKLLATKWTRSNVNGGRIMLNAPEVSYPAVNGSHDWMRSQIENDLTAILGSRDLEAGRAVMLPPQPPPFGIGLPAKLPAWDYTIVSDRNTEAEAARGQPASYKVIVTDRRKGTTDVLRREDGTELRYRWDAAPVQAAEREARNFEMERRRVFGLSDIGAP